MKFNENPCSLSRVFPCGRTDIWTNMKKLTGAFLNFANAPIRVQQHSSWTLNTVVGCISETHVGNNRFNFIYHNVSIYMNIIRTSKLTQSVLIS